MRVTLRTLVLVTFLNMGLLAAPGDARGESSLRYPIIGSADLNIEYTHCDSLDRYLRQVDSLRWSMREDGVELETEFEHMVQLSVATAAAIAVAVPIIAAGIPDLTLAALPYGIAYTAADNLKKIDALLIAMLAKRQELQCPPHPECIIRDDDSDTLASLRNVREQVENKEITEGEGLETLTALLDNLCPVGTRYLECIGGTEELERCKVDVTE